MLRRRSPPCNLDPASADAGGGDDRLHSWQPIELPLRQPACKEDCHQCVQRTLTSVWMPVCASASAGTGGGDAGLHSGQNMIASNCVSANQRTRLSRESGPLKSDSHSGKGAPKGSSCRHSMQLKTVESCRRCLQVHPRTGRRWMLQSCSALGCLRVQAMVPHAFLEWCPGRCKSHQ